MIEIKSSSGRLLKVGDNHQPKLNAHVGLEFTLAGSNPNLTLNMDGLKTCTKINIEFLFGWLSQVSGEKASKLGLDIIVKISGYTDAAQPLRSRESARPVLRVKHTSICAASLRLQVALGLFAFGSHGLGVISVAASPLVCLGFPSTSPWHVRDVGSVRTKGVCLGAGPGCRICLRSRQRLPGQKAQLVRVNTVLGSAAPPLTVNLRQIFVSGSKDASVVNQKLKFDPDSGMHVLETLPTNIDIGNYVFSFEIILDDPEYKKTYVTGGRTKVPIHLTGVVQVDNAEIAVLDSDLGSVEMHKKLDLSGGSTVSLYANHLQKLRLSFTLTSPSGHAFKPHQAFLSLRHDSGVEHIFVVSNSGTKFETILDFLGLVEKFYYLSGKYDIQLTVGDSVMENSFFQLLGLIELDLPDAPEKAAHPPPQSVDPYSSYGPKAEITHIFRAPEKRPPRELSLVFLGLVLLPFLGFLAGLFYLRANLKNLPRSTIPAAFAIFFHLGIAAVLSLYALFWFKLDLFTTLKALGILGMFLMFVGHKTLSHLASTSAKLKSA
ncbi:dolichyl-diphosphooligosaccharide--protein glycosyltransferase subunit 2-like [Henckelia pumila]|uniref:dolichyl-diphosphooligosaccharide--protein glycosyltransferase subunit 2-like n=1 Tax=Henckelia pumila TaxID=405737 RepID=UPI003C6E43C1